MRKLIYFLLFAVSLNAQVTFQRGSLKWVWAYLKQSNYADYDTSAIKFDYASTNGRWWIRQFDEAGNETFTLDTLGNVLSRAITVGSTAANGTLNFTATDGDAAQIENNTSDQLVFSGAGGGYDFQGGNLIVDTNTLYVNSSTNRVGIGTASPSNELHVLSSSAFTMGARFETNSAQTGWSNHPVMILKNINATNNNAEAIRFQDSGGNIIGQFGAVNIDHAGDGYVYMGGNAADLQIDHSGNVSIPNGDLTLGSPSANGTVNFTATDGDSAQIANNTSDQLVFSGASGGYVFQSGVDIVAGNGDQLDLDNTGQQYTQMNFLNNGSLKANFYWDNTASTFYIGPTGNGSAVVQTNGSPAIIADASQDVSIPNGDLTLSGKFYNIPDHAYIAFQDSAVAISIGVIDTWYQVTNATDSLFGHVETGDGFTVSGDTITYTGPTAAHVNFIVPISGYGSNTNDYEFRVYNITDAASVPVMMDITGTGANNRVSVTVSAYDVNANPNDQYILQVRNRSATNDFTMEDCSILAEVVHYIGF